MSTAEFAKAPASRGQRLPTPTPPSEGEPFDPSQVESLLVLDPMLLENIRSERANRGIDGHDEVWDGVYIMPPIANNEHQTLAYELSKALDAGLESGVEHRVIPGANVSDRKKNWSKNFCVPDVLVLLPGCAAINHGTFFEGGPSFAVEVASKGDRSRDKLPFYGKVHTGEVLIIDRDPWQLELYRLNGEAMAPAGVAKPGDDVELTTKELPFAFKLRAAEGDGRPVVVVRHTGGKGEWSV